jgi:hypothetical protein
MPTPPPVATPAAPDTDREALVRELSMHAMTALRALRHEAQRVFEPLGLRPSQVLVLEMIHRGLDQPKLLAEDLGHGPERRDRHPQRAAGRRPDRPQHRSRRPPPRARARHRARPGMLAQAGQAWLQAAEATLAGVGLDDLQATAAWCGR